MIQQEKACDLFRYWMSINCGSDEIVKCYLTSLLSYEQEPGSDPKRLSFLTLKVGEHIRDSGNLKEAIPFFHKALLLRQKIFGEVSSEVAQTINEIGRLYYRLGRNTETLEMWERSLAIRECLEKRNDGDIGVALNNLGLIYHRLGRIEESEAAYQKCKK
jgi:tetratricopeptide (TPR) repeat protein